MSELDLRDFNPKWFGPPGFVHSPEARAVKIGFVFYCPCKACEGRRGQSRISVFVKPPIDPFGVLPNTTWVQPEPAWNRKGDTFETITLEPSIDQSRSGHWHGHIINGKLITA